MPRKQRFKPSRKPKPSPETEETATGQSHPGTVSHPSNDRGGPEERGVVVEVRDDPPTASEADDRPR
ncbi:MAG: hypothetical protein H7138_02715 [Myxococcales bacterium]|nr:hypothetical protein [Myxococcales bacterium]